MGQNGDGCTIILISTTGCLVTLKTYKQKCTEKQTYS